LVRFSISRHWTVILGFFLIAALSAAYFVANVAISTDTNKLMSSSLPWRQQQVTIDAAFPERIGRIVAVVDAATPELAEEAADALVAELSPRSDVIRSVERVDGDFFQRSGILFLSLDEVRRNTEDLISAQPFLGTLAADPTLRGILHALSQSLEGVRLGRAKLDDLRPAFAAIADALQAQARGIAPAFSWRTLISGRSAKASELRRFVNIRPILDFADLEPGGKSTAVIRDVVSRLGFKGIGVKVRLTGSVVLADEEFKTIADGAGLNALGTLFLVLFVLWLALKNFRIILAVFVNLLVGLVLTAAAGLAMVGALNPISVAFAVLFVGLGVDFGIQFSVRYRAERFEDGDLRGALLATAREIAGPLLLAAASIAAAFYSFLSTAYVGLSELGLIAGTGILIALMSTVTLLPALIAVLNPPAEKWPVGYAALAPLDRGLYKQRKWIVGGTLALTILGLPLLAGLRFDFNPLNLRDQKSESMSTLLELMNDPDTTPNTIDVLKPNLAEAERVAETLRGLAEVRQVLTLQSFVPKEQDAKLALIEDANFFFQNTLAPDQLQPAPLEAETRAALETFEIDLSDAARGLDSPAAVQARRLSSLISALAKGPASALNEAERAFVGPLKTTLRQIQNLLSAELVTVDILPPALKRLWVSADGRALMEVAPTGDANDNANLSRFVFAVRAVEPDAAGTPIFMIEAGDSMVTAFIHAGVFSVASIALILLIVLRRWIDVALTLVPLLVAIIVTLEICSLIGLKLNFANIIALPLLLGVGVAFKVYYIVAWRGGETKFLQSPLTRAIVFSASTTAIAFGSLWLSHHPGTSSMGKLMALSLFTTLAAAVIFQPALMATQSKKRPESST
jgi:hopanoid biosynthesis associated RND transporter like protein HpnN